MSSLLNFSLPLLFFKYFIMSISVRSITDCELLEDKYFYHKTQWKTTSNHMPDKCAWVRWCNCVSGGGWGAWLPSGSSPSHLCPSLVVGSTSGHRTLPRVFKFCFIFTLVCVCLLQNISTSASVRGCVPLWVAETWKKEEFNKDRFLACVIRNSKVSSPGLVWELPIVTMNSGSFQLSVLTVLPLCSYLQDGCWGTSLLKDIISALLAR